MIESVRVELAAFEQRMAERLRSEVALIQLIGDELVSAGGKRLRPAVALLAGKLLGAGSPAALQVALAVELLHSASLLHDDLIDEAELRRGQEAAFRRYGNTVSVLSGDYMLAKVLGLLAEIDESAFTRLIADTAVRICEAEVLQFQAAKLEEHTFEGYQRIIEGKTAVLLAAASEGVAVLARAPELQRLALRDFGMRYGRAFQLQDDYLDLLGTAEALGKPVGGDLREGKATYAVLCLLAQGVDEARAILRRRASHHGDVERMVALVRAHGADDRMRELIRAESAAAVEALSVFPESPARSALAALAERELDRVS